MKPRPPAPPEEPVEPHGAREYFEFWKQRESHYEDDDYSPTLAGYIKKLLAHADLLRDELRQAREGAAAFESCNRARQAAEAEVVALRARVERLTEALRDAVYTVSNATKGSIGSVDNVYLPQIGVEEVERWRAALADTEECR